MKKEVIIELLFDLAGLDPDWIDGKYKNLFTRWKFDNSDEVWIDGELIDKSTKRAIKNGFYNIQPKPNEIIVSEMKDGFPLTEQMFVKKMIRKLSQFTNADYPDDTWQMRIDLFLEYLKKKETTLQEKKNISEKSKKHDRFKNADFEKLNDLFVLKFTAGVKPTILDRLKTDLSIHIIEYKNNQIVAIASILYDYLHKTVKPRNFSDWLKTFSQIIDIQTPTTKRNAVQTEIAEFKKFYYYLNSL
jgi:hypothetical protein